MSYMRRWRSLLVILVLLQEAMGTTALLRKEQVHVNVNEPDEIYLKSSIKDPRRVYEDDSYYSMYRRFLQGIDTTRITSRPSSSRRSSSNGGQRRDPGYAKSIYQIHSMIVARQDPTSMGHRNRQWGRRRHMYKRRLGRSEEWNRRDANLNNPSSLIVGGIPGTIDIVSPTADDPVGVKLAALLISTGASDLNQFVLTASDADASTIYLVVRGSTPLADGSLTVGLEVPVLDESKMSYIPYCATFDTSKASPLTAMECLTGGQGVSANSSQLFAYNPANGIIKPLWLESALLNEASSADPVGSSAPPAAIQRNPKIVTTIHSTNKDAENLSAPQTRNISLVFTPELSPTIPVVNNRVSETTAPPLTTSSVLPSPEASSMNEASAPASSVTVTPTSTIIDDPMTFPAPPETTQSMNGDSEDSVVPSQLANNDADLPEGEAPTSTRPGASAAITSTSPSSYSAPVTSSLPTKKRRCNISTESTGSKGCEIAPSSAVDDSSVQTGEKSFQDYDVSSLTPVDTGYAWKFNPLQNTQT